MPHEQQTNKIVVYYERSIDLQIIPTHLTSTTKAIRPFLKKKGKKYYSDTQKEENLPISISRGRCVVNAVQCMKEERRDRAACALGSVG